MPIDMVQSLVVEVDSAKLLEQYFRLAVVTALSSDQELAVKMLDRDKQGFNLGLPSAVYDQNKHFPVILIGGWYYPVSREQNSYFDGYGPWTTFRSDGTTSSIDGAWKFIDELFRAHGSVWGHQFRKKFGDGYNSTFNHLDGSVVTGFELRTCGHFPELIAISLVHVYYGK